MLTCGCFVRKRFRFDAFRKKKRAFAAEVRKALKGVTWANGPAFVRADKVYEFVKHDADVRSYKYEQSRAEINSLVLELKKDVDAIQGWVQSHSIEEDKKAPVIDQLDTNKEMSCHIDEAVAGMKEARLDGAHIRAAASRKKLKLYNKYQDVFEENNVPPVLVDCFTDAFCDIFGDASDKEEDLR